MFDEYSKVNEEYLDIRRIVIENKKPRRLTVKKYIFFNNSFQIQGNIFMSEENKLSYKVYEEDFGGIIQSFVERFP